MSVKITFGMIVFNAEKNLPNGMLSACIQNIYDFAHEIIIVEGATKAVNHYFDGDTTSFTNNGKSNDRTLEIIKSFPDPLNKIKLIESNGFWDGKTQMCNEYSKIATGDYIWQLDSDEFYHHEDIETLISILEKKKIDAVHFYANHFFGGYDYCIDENDNKWANQIPWMRIFRNVPGKSYWISHEPPNYVCDGTVCNNGKALTRDQTLALGIKLYHYSYVEIEQVKFKAIFYRNEKCLEEWNKFTANKEYKPFGCEINKFNGEHPSIIRSKYLL